MSGSYFSLWEMRQIDTIHAVENNASHKVLKKMYVCGLNQLHLMDCRIIYKIIYLTI
jgi:hypothetical protein